MKRSLQELRQENEGENKSLVLEIPVFIKDTYPLNQLDKLIVILKNNELGNYSLINYCPWEFIDPKKEYTELTWRAFVLLENATADEIFLYLRNTFPGGLKTELL